MQLIKKYANRKLYHTNRKHYITLDGIAQLIQAGEAVQVRDNETGSDITAAILLQIVLQMRDRTGSPLPASALTSLIQLGGDALTNLRELREALFALLGGPDRVDAEIERRLDQLVHEGALAADEAARLGPLLLRHDLTVPHDYALSGAPLVPRRSDIIDLHAQVDALAAAVEQLFHQQIHQTDTRQ